MDTNQLIDLVYLLPPASKAVLSASVKEITLPKGHILLRSDCIEKHIYFIRKGVVRAYLDAPDKQVTFWFGMEGSPVLPMKSYVSDEKNYESIELLEDCELCEFSISSLRTLYKTDVDLANWGRKLAEQELIKTEERLIAMQFKTAQERYIDLINQQPEILLRVQLGYIASYLGMSQVSLSRIRAELRS
jgi:CRP-like cAMP-binding protein